MKILIIFTFYLISGPVDCSDVIGYSGGSVTIFSDLNWYASNNKYICKVKGKGCTNIIRVVTKHHQVQDGRFILYSNTDHFFVILVRKLRLQDAGTYRFGLGHQSNATVNLKVFNDPCCTGPKIQTAYAGQNITITCNYPRTYETNYKYITKLNDDNNIKQVVDTNTNLQNDRFFITDDKSAKVVSVDISNVRKADEGFYLFGIWGKKGSVSYKSYFTEIQLYITVRMSTTIQPTSATYMTTSQALTKTEAVYLTLFGCVSLLLIAAFALLIYELKCRRTQGSTPSPRRHSVSKRAHFDDVNALADLPLHENLSLYEDPSINQPDSIYECLNHETLINSVYNTIQFK